jgi:uncharacterized protein (TIGR00645 family)
MSFRQKLEDGFETALFASRWFMAPFYAGLAVALVVLMFTFGKEVIEETFKLGHLDETAVTVWVLSLIDMSLAANLTVMVMFAGYENFVSKLDLAGHKDRPGWMGRVGFGDLKLKLMASIVAISAIHVLESFMNVERLSDRELGWSVGIHMAFVVSGLLLALMDRLTVKAPE